jgi:hypothetical protein
MWQSKEIKMPVDGKSRIKLYTANVNSRDGFIPATWGDAEFYK